MIRAVDVRKSFGDRVAVDGVSVEVDRGRTLGLLGPKGTPAEAVKRLHAETVKALQLPDVRERLAGAALQPVGSTPEEFGALIRNEIDSFGKLARELGIQPQ